MDRSHLIRQNGWYSVRVKVPPSLRGPKANGGLPESLYKSLRTKSIKVANQRKHAVIDKLKKRIEKHRQRDTDQSSAEPASEASAASTLARVLDELRRLRESQRTGETDRETAQLEGIEQILKAYEQPTAGMQRGTPQGERYVFPDAQTEATVIQAAKMDPSTWTLREVINAYLEDRRKLDEDGHPIIRPSTWETTRRRLEQFATWMGGDPAIRSITRDDARRYVTQVIEPRGRSAKTTRDHISNTGTLFSWAMKPRQGFADINPFAGLSDRDENARGKAKKRPWNEQELYALLSGPASPTLRHMMVLAMFSGMRLNEITELSLDRVKDDCLILDEAKSQAGIRTVPIHSVLRPLIKRLRKASTDGYLIPDLKRQGKDKKRGRTLSTDFLRYRRSIGFAAKTTDFHSFRRSFANAMRNAGISLDVMHAIIGHEDSDLTTGLYAGTPPFALLRSAMEKVSHGAAVDALAKGT